VSYIYLVNRQRSTGFTGFLGFSGKLLPFISPFLRWIIRKGHTGDYAGKEAVE
jgi:hypothetical protein